MDNKTIASPHVKYTDSLSRFRIYGTFAILIVVPLLAAFLTVNHHGEEILSLIFPLILLFIILSPVVFNYFPSAFQERRRLVSAFTGSGSILLSVSPWPCFRLLIYEDAVEIRIMFQRYLIPYEKMADLQEKIGFWSRGILFRADLPGVPSIIQFRGLGLETKKILKILTETRSMYLESKMQ